MYKLLLKWILIAVAIVAGINFLNWLATGNTPDFENPPRLVMPK